MQEGLEESTGRMLTGFLTKSAVLFILLDYDCEGRNKRQTGETACADSPVCTVS